MVVRLPAALRHYGIRLYLKDGRPTVNGDDLYRLPAEKRAEVAGLLEAVGRDPEEVIRQILEDQSPIAVSEPYRSGSLKLLEAGAPMDEVALKLARGYEAMTGDRGFYKSFEKLVRERAIPSG